MQKYTVRYDKTQTKYSLFSDGKLALGILVGSLSVIISLILWEFFSGGGDTSVYLSLAPLIVSLLVALGSSYFAASALLEQRRLREAGTDPVLIVHLGRREDARELVTLLVSNVGAGAALNVHIELEEPIEDADEREKRGFVQNVFARREPFAVILQGASIEFNFALGWRLLGQEGRSKIEESLPKTALPPFKAKLSYEDLSGGRYDGVFTLNVNELRGLGTHKSPQMRIVSALETIAKRSEA